MDIFVVDAFTSSQFKGNPAAVCPLPAWLPDGLMQDIAAENNLSETAFFIPSESGFQIRWFTPTTEVDLCGHATLASAHVLFRHLGYTGDTVRFDSRSGPLSVMMREEVLYLDFPSKPAVECECPRGLTEAFGVRPVEMLAAEYYLMVFDSEEVIRSAEPDMGWLAKVDKSVIITAAGNQFDFVSRFFAVPYGIPEDPVTGSSHCTLIPYWADKLGKTEMTAYQASRRGGKLYCRYERDRVKIGGEAVTFLQGKIRV